MDTPSKIGVGISIGICVIIVGGITTLAYRLLFSTRKPKTLTNPKVKVKLQLTDVENVTHDTKLFTFKLPSPEHVLGIETGQHVYLTATVDGEIVSRPYTPISSTDQCGFVKFIIKIYKPNERFPKGGKMTQYMDTLIPMKSMLDFRGPSGKIIYRGNGKFIINKSKNNFLNMKVKNISLIAGGTGITPMYQLIERIVNDPNDKTQIKLLYANNTPADIILRDRLEELSKKSTKLSIWYTVTNPEDEKWNHSKGRINLEMIRKHCHPASYETTALLCGSYGFVNETCIPSLKSLSYQEDRIYAY